MNTRMSSCEVQKRNTYEYLCSLEENFWNSVHLFYVDLEDWKIDYRWRKMWLSQHKWQKADTKVSSSSMILHPSLVWCIQVCVSGMVSECPCVGDFWLCLGSYSGDALLLWRPQLHSGLFCSAQKIAVAALARCRVTLWACASTWSHSMQSTARKPLFDTPWESSELAQGLNTGSTLTLFTFLFVLCCQWSDPRPFAF